MHILLISFHYPPDSDIGSVRPAAFVRSLREWGHQVTVISSALPLIESGPEPDVVRPGWFDLRYFKSVRPSRAAPTKEPIPASANTTGAQIEKKPRTGWLRSILTPGSPLRRVVAAGRANVIELPDERGGWIPSATSAALRAAGTNGCDLVIASGPPFAALVVAHRVAERLKIPWIADYRDLWSNGSYYSRSGTRQKLDAYIERRVLSNCTSAITVSLPLADDLRRDFSIPVEEVLNGYDPATVVPIREREPLSSARLNLLYVGNNFYGKLRTPKDLLCAARELRLTREDICFHFLGSDPGLVEQFTTPTQTGDLVRVHGAVPRERAIEMQARADALLLLMWNNPAEAGTYSGKIFEYIAVRRPIVICGYADGVAANLVRERGLGHVVNDQRSAVGALSSLLASKPDNRLLPDLEPELRVGLSRAEQNLRLKAVIDNLVATNGREVSQRDGSVPMSQGISSDLSVGPDPGALDN